MHKLTIFRLHQLEVKHNGFKWAYRPHLTGPNASQTEQSHSLI